MNHDDPAHYRKDVAKNHTKRRGSLIGGLMAMLMMVAAFEVMVMVAAFEVMASSQFFFRGYPNHRLVAEAATAPGKKDESGVTASDFCGGRRLAFVWYLSDPSGYACSIVASIQKLRDLGAPGCVDTAVVYNRDHVESEMIARLNRTNLVSSFHGFDDIPETTSGISYYKGVLTKLSIFRVPYDRIIFLDADSYPLRPLHNLFDLPPGLPDFWAVRPHWLPHTEVCSVLMVLSPDPGIYESIKQKYFPHGTTPEGMYDMDMLGRFFKKNHKTGLLPGSLLELDSYVEEEDDPTLLENISLLHYSGHKPWEIRPYELKQLNDIHDDWKQRVEGYCTEYEVLLE